ncbi:MAG: DEAD/DEAH box helicase [Candidatus Woesearchaeota archaeon]
MNDFIQLGVSQHIANILAHQGITKPTTIQKKTIPGILEGKDVIAQSATGSGKTLAFGCGILQRLKLNKRIQALILTPTRELAEQVYQTLSLLTERNIEVAKIYGGVAIEPQIKALHKAHIVIGTPGRVLDHMQRGTIDVSAIEYFVLDEADRMLDMGFLDDVKDIMNACSSGKQIMLFSATMPQEIKTLSQSFMDNPIHVVGDQAVDPTQLEQIYYDVPASLKFSLLVHLLQQEKDSLVMVFCNSRRVTSQVTQNLKLQGIDASEIHGGLSQNRRNHALQKFSNQKTQVLVCTDVAARGIDVTGISHVYNYDIPDDPKQYVHRIGRTARAGKSGIAISLLSRYDYEKFDRLLKETNCRLTAQQKPHIERVELQQSKSDRVGRGGRTMSRDRPRLGSSKPQLGSSRERSSSSRSRTPRFGGDDRRSERSHDRPQGQSRPSRFGGDDRRSDRSHDRPQGQSRSPRFGGDDRRSEREHTSGNKSFAGKSYTSQDDTNRSSRRPSSKGSFAKRDAQRPRRSSSRSSRSQR